MQLLACCFPLAVLALAEPLQVPEVLLASAAALCSLSVTVASGPEAEEKAGLQLPGSSHAEASPKATSQLASGSISRVSVKCRLDRLYV